MSTVASFPACALWTRSQAADPVGSSPRLDHLMLVETPLPWPRDVKLIDTLAPFAKRDPLVRVLAVAPRAESADNDTRLVVHWRRLGSHRFEGVDHRVSENAVPELLETLFTGGAEDGRAARLGPAVPTAGADLLVCTHGRRDRCCGGAGTKLFNEVDGRWPDVRAWRCSHLGGHRYAPTAVTLPTGRFWAHLDADLLDGVVTATTSPAGLEQVQRGSAAVDPVAQIVERALFSRFGWAWMGAQLDRVAVHGSGAGPYEVAMSWTASGTAAATVGNGRARGTVAVARQVPVPVCGEDPDQSGDTHPEYVLTDLVITPDR